MKRSINKLHTALKFRIKDLQRDLLPNQRVDADYSRLEQAQIRAFRLLAHAELEYYFEEVCRSVAKRAWELWSKKKKPTTVLLAITAHYEKFLPPLGESSQNSIERYRADGMLHLADRINAAFSNYMRSINDNHGIKALNVRTLVLPLGFHLSDLDPTWLIELDNYGLARGAIAHGADVTKVNWQPDPVNEWSKIQQVLNGCEDFKDRLITVATS